MFKQFASALVLAAISSVTSAQNCAICWDGSEATFVDNACVCPAAIPDEPTVEEEEPLASNPNCTTGNANACNRANGFFDFVSCTCAFPPIAAPEDWTPPKEYTDDYEDDYSDEEWELEEEYFFELEQAFDEYTSLALKNVIFAAVFSAIATSGKDDEDASDDDDDAPKGS